MAKPLTVDFDTFAKLIRHHHFEQNIQLINVEDTG